MIFFTYKEEQGFFHYIQRTHYVCASHQNPRPLTLLCQ